ncbi:hypothetical protein A3Q56_02769 [Intoshia linei]|uniref:ShKT domain-containing protein n=1 Tax=Intoshia linei TaxID=1819745 RepID=A0A177B592_9BILA|nr:hypothetical protein A3Q56_02769 [Intoshia linei]
MNLIKSKILLFLFLRSVISQYVNVKLIGNDTLKWPNHVILEIEFGNQTVNLDLVLKDQGSVPIFLDGQEIPIENNDSQNHYLSKKNKGVLTIYTLDNGNNFTREYEGSFYHGNDRYSINPIKRGHFKRHVVRKIEDSPQIYTRAKRAYKKHHDEIKLSKRDFGIKINVFYVEIVFLLDYTIWKSTLNQMGSESAAIKEIRRIYGHIITGVSMAYSTIDFDKYKFELRPYLKQIEITKTEKSSDYVYSAIEKVGSSFGETVYNGDKALDNIGNWAKNYDSIKNTWTDHVMHWSLHNIFGDGTIGYAYLSQICTQTFSVSTCQYRGIHDWSTAAHELAHSMGSEHDASGSSKNCPQDSFNIMHPGGGSVSFNEYENSFYFSHCSIVAMHNTILGKDLTSQMFQYPRICLYNKVCGHGVDIDITSLPGETYTLDNICSMYNDYKSNHCKIVDPKEYCYTIYCDKPNSNMCTSLSYHKILEGTSCVTGKWCIKGACVEKTNLKPTNLVTGECVKGKIKKDVPAGCINEYSNCESILTKSPQFCFEADLSVKCCNYCHSKGFYVDESYITINTTPTTTTTSTTKKTTTSSTSPYITRSSTMSSTILPTTMAQTTSTLTTFTTRSSTKSSTIPSTTETTSGNDCKDDYDFCSKYANYCNYKNYELKFKKSCPKTCNICA